MEKFLLIDSLGGGGAENLNIALLQNSNLKAIFTLDNIISYDVSKIHVINLNESTKKLLYLKYLKIPFDAFRLSKQLKQGDLILASLYRSTIVALLCQLFFKKIKVIAWVHSDCKRDMNNTFKYINMFKNWFNSRAYFLRRPLLIYSKIIHCL